MASELSALMSGVHHHLEPNLIFLDVRKRWHQKMHLLNE